MSKKYPNKQELIAKGYEVPGAMILEELKELEVAKYITVLDFEAGSVHRYDVGFQVNTLGWQPDNESCENYLTNKGHNLANCEWMVHSSADVITN